MFGLEWLFLGPALAKAAAATAAVGGATAAGAGTAAALTNASATTPVLGSVGASASAVPASTIPFTPATMAVTPAMPAGQVSLAAKLGALAKGMGFEALKGGVTGGTIGAISGNQDKRVGSGRGALMGALGGAATGGTLGGISGVSDWSNLASGLVGPGEMAPSAMSLGQRLLAGSKDLLIGDQPLRQILGNAAPGMVAGAMPNMVKAVNLNVPIGKQQRIQVQPFGWSGLTGRGLRLARHWR